MGEMENEHSPPSSAEEAAALLGAAISFDAPMVSPKAAGHANPPKGMHSIFTVQSPVPNQVLFVRLCNLRAWLRWHADALQESPELEGLDDGVSAIIITNHVPFFCSKSNPKNLPERTRINSFYRTIFLADVSRINNWEYLFPRRKGISLKNHSTLHVPSWQS